MAVSGADWRKSADGYRTEAAPRVGSVRSEDGGCRSGVARTLADDTDRSENGVGFDPVETDGGAVPGPLAIGVPAGAVPTTGRPDGGHTEDVAAGVETTSPAGDGLDGSEGEGEGESELSLRYLSTRSGSSRGRDDPSRIHDGEPGANESRRRTTTTDQTVIFK